MTRSALLTGTGVLALILSAGAFAAGDMGHGMGKGMHGHDHMGMHGDPAAMADHMMGQFDLNKDGKITKDEIVNASRKEADAHFAAMDANKDGKVSADEMFQAHAARMREHTDEMFKHLDANGDGKVTQGEFAAAGPMIMMHHHRGMGGHEGMGDDENDDE